MFTGIVEEIGAVSGLYAGEAGTKVGILAGFAGELREGDSIAVEGVCLTATTVRPDGFDADVMNQTLSLTTLGDLSGGSRVNLEPALRAGDPLGGHIVQGHVDGVGEVLAATEDGFARRLRVRVPDGLERYLVEHGSVTVAGVSLTVAGLDQDWFEVSLIPETLERTTLGAAAVGTRVNLELDVVARYVERLLGFNEGSK
ncbi:MAG: riboflavin synthase [Solirubrobacterales bacterium]|jgi:riboflavin synthase|nr:riboflavin synthase [Solirubrobacterales bacterium]